MLTGQLGEYAVSVRTEDLADNVIHAAKRCVLDWLSAAVPGGVEDPAKFIALALSEEVAAGTARLVPGGEPATPRTAALINGTAAHTLEVDDIFRDGIYHPGPPVIAAALAVAQSRGLSGRDFIAAIVAGYEISNRIGKAVQPAHYDFWHTTGTVGAFGAAAAAARAMSLSASRAKHALANAATFAAALRQAFRSDAMSKPLHAGRAAETGVLCALMAEKGVTGADNMLEGERGFGNAMSRDVDWERAFADLGRDFTITRMTQKNHCCCGHTFAAVDGVIGLCSEHGLRADDIQEIDIGSYEKASEVCGNRDPQTPYEAKFSMVYVCAMAVLTGSVRLAAFTRDWLCNPDLRALMGRVNVRTDERAQAVFPMLRSAYVTIKTRDGRKLEHHSPTRKGDPDAPLTDNELESKFRELSGSVLSPVEQDHLIGRVRMLDRIDNVRALI